MLSLVYLGLVVALAVTVSLLTSKLEEPIQQEVSFPLRMTRVVMIKQAGNRLDEAHFYRTQVSLPMSVTD